MTDCSLYGYDSLNHQGSIQYWTYHQCLQEAHMLWRVLEQVGHTAMLSVHQADRLMCGHESLLSKKWWPYLTFRICRGCIILVSHLMLFICSSHQLPLPSCVSYYPAHKKVSSHDNVLPVKDAAASENSIEVCIRGHISILGHFTFDTVLQTHMSIHAIIL